MLFLVVFMPSGHRRFKGKTTSKPVIGPFQTPRKRIPGEVREAIKAVLGEYRKKWRNEKATAGKRVLDKVTAGKIIQIAIEGGVSIEEIATSGMLKKNKGLRGSA
jgi:hypothetical protein